MDLSRAALLRDVVAETELGATTSRFAHAVRRYTTRPNGLLLVRTEAEEPWHLTAHLDEELHRAGAQDLRPTLVRWAPPPHLAVGLERFRVVGRGESLLVVSEDAPSDALLERVDHVKRRGATIFTIDNGDPGLLALSHEALVPGQLLPPTTDQPWIAGALDLHAPATTLTDIREAVVGFEISQHLVSLAVADHDVTPAGWRTRLRTLIERLGGEEA